MKWYFSPQLPGQVETEVTQRDQFSNDEVEISETIVREAVQNSLDAAVDDPSRVRVTFRWLDSSDGLEPEFLKGLFDAQLEHASEAGLDLEAVDFSSPRALVIEDFGTRGLTGSVNSKDDDNFSDFWRRHGKSHKTGKSRGRWGLGKLVYSTSSELGVFFGATVRDGDTSTQIMGQTVLNLRTVGDHKYPPHAFFADIEGEGDIYKEMPVPLKDPSLVEQFETQFSLERVGKPGLSVIIPFPNPDFRLDAMLGVAIVNYFYPLVTGQLVLQFNDVEINSGNIRQLAHEYASDSFQDIDTLFDFIEQANRTDDEDLLTLRESWADDTKLDADDFDEEDLEVIREKFASGKLVGLRLPITLKEKTGVEKKSSFRVFIQRPKELIKGLDLYVRGGLTLPGEAKFRERKALGAMIAEDEAICSFLGDAENAAHTKWISNAEKVRKNYRSPQARLQVIKNSVVELYDLLAEVTEEVDELALSSFFWSKEPEGKKGGKKKKTPVVIPTPPEPRPKDFSISPVEGGFSVSTHKDANPERFPRTVTIDVAYDVASGNPFKKYSPLDFRIDKKDNIEVALTKDSGAVFERKENRLKVRVEKLPFRLHVNGFDPLRDVKVKLISEA
ncbi:MAG: hypothetical protein V7720_01545 [Halioglobus sp.]